MFEAQLLRAVEGAEYSIFSPWFPRQGDNAIFTVQTVDQDGEPVLTVRAYTKNSEDEGGGTDADTWTGKAEELVRYHFTLSGGTGDWILFRMLSPVWFDDVSV